MLYTSTFAIGHVFVVPNGGLQPTNASGTELQVIQDFSVEFVGKGVELRGQYLYAVDARVADISGKGKFKVGQWNLEQLNNLFFSGTLTTNNVPDMVYADEPHVIANAGSPPVPTVTVTNTTGFVQPLTVSYASNGSNLDEVATSPLVGQYTASAGGVFTFNATDLGNTVNVSYISQGIGSQGELLIPNNLQGQSPTIGIAGINIIDGHGFFFPNCRVTGVKPVNLKNNAFNYNEVDFQVYVPTGQPVGYLIQQSI